MSPKRNAHQASAAPSASRRRLVFWGIVLLYLLFQIAAQWKAPTSEAWLRGPMRDDAYYYLVIARSLDEGEGLTYGGQPTNGFQPLFLLLCWLVGAAADWHRVLTPVATMAASFLAFATLGPLLLRRILEQHVGMRERAFFLAPLVWLSSSAAARSAMNGMESAWVSLAWLAFIHTSALWRAEPERMRRGALFGCTLGFGFLIRNDFVVVAPAVLFLVGAALNDAKGEAQRSRVLRSAIIAGALTFAIASPWLAHNYLRFGSVVPQSGAAEAVGSLNDHGRLFQWLHLFAGVARNLLPPPLGLSHLGTHVGGALGAALGAGALTLYLRSCGVAGRRLLLPTVAATTLLMLVYGALFGAPHWATRWMLPWAAVAAVAIAILLDRIARRGRELAFRTLITGLVLSTLGYVALDGYRARKPSWAPVSSLAIMRFGERLAPDLSVGSLQSGLPAWVVPRFRNLDGKMSLDALEAIHEGTYGRWLAESGLDVIVDTHLWGYEDDPSVREVYDRQRLPGLIVLHRKELVWDAERGVPTQPEAPSR